MVKSEYYISLILACLMLLCGGISIAGSTEYEIIQLTDNQTDDNHPVLNNSGQIAWLTNIYASRLWPRHKLSFYDGKQTVMLDAGLGKRVSWQSINDRGQISYVSYDPANWQDSTISMIDGLTRLIDDMPGEITPYYDNNRTTLNNNFLLWYNNITVGCEGEVCRDFHLYDLASNKSIDLDFTEGMDWLDINNGGQVVWRADGNVMFFDGTETRSLGPGNYPSINDNGQILWLNNDDDKFRLYDSANDHEITTNVSGDAAFGILFRFNDLGQIVWIGRDVAANEISIYISDGFETTRIGVPSSINPYSFHLNNRGQIAWLGYDPTDPAGENHAFVYDGNDVIQLDTAHLTNHIDSLDFNDNGQVVMSASDGNDTEIFFARNKSEPLELYY